MPLHAPQIDWGGSGLILSLVLLTALWALAGCGAVMPADGALPRAERPAATSTPAWGSSGVHAAPAPPAAPQPAPPPAAAGDPAAWPLVEQLASVVVPTRDLRDLALRLNPSAAEIPVVVHTTPPAPAVGDVEPFWVHDLDDNRKFQVDAELVHVNEAVYMWVESGQEYDHDAVVASIDRFAQQTYPAAVSFFGSEWKPGVDNDPRLHVLHAAGLGGGTAGYYSSADQYSALANPYSNEKEMFYINLSWLNAARDYTYYETVLAHEFQHMIHWYKDRNEETWVNEGLSEFAQEVAGYDPDTLFASTFATLPDTQLNTWNEVTESNAEHYGSAYLLMAYLAQRFGPELTQAVVADPANGIAGIDHVLQTLDTGPTFDSLFADWVVANYVDDSNALGLEGVYGYQKFSQDPPTLERSFDLYPVAPYSATVSNYATDYLLLKGQGDVEVLFDGQTATTLTPTQPASGRFAWWSNRGDDSDSRLTRQFDLSSLAPNSPVELSAAFWWDIETGYDYGYVLASRDGLKWDILPGRYTTLDNSSGNSFGAAYTGRSSADGSSTEDASWVTERFDLSAYAGAPVWIRFEYVTDDAVNASGWLVDDVSIPAIGYQSDFEMGADGWMSEGWLLTDGRLPQRWLLQVLELEENRLVAVERPLVDTDGAARIAVNDLGGGRAIALAISALAPVTTEPAAYTVEIQTR